MNKNGVFFTQRFGLLAVCLLGAGILWPNQASSAVPSIVNGNFEAPAEPAGTITRNPGDGWGGSTLGGEYIVSGNVQALGNGGAFFGVTPYGNQYLGLDAQGDHRFPSVDFQTIAGFVAGTTYNFNVYFSNLAGASDSSVLLSLSDGVTGKFITELSVPWQGTSGPYGNGTIRFQLATLTYTATQSGSLDFAITNGSSQGLMAIDNVSISVVPEPSTWAMLGVGAVGMGAVVLRRRRVGAWR